MQIKRRPAQGSLDPRKQSCRRGLRIAHAHALAARVLLGVVCLFVATACASYQAGSGDRQIPGGYRAIAVPVFKNNSHDAGAEVFFTNAMIRELERSKIGTVTDKDLAQVTLEGTVDSIQYYGGAPVQGDPSNNPVPSGSVLNTTYRIVVNATLRLRRNSDGRLLWSAGFQKETSYQTPKVGYEPLTSVNALYNQSARYQNLEILAADMMSEAHDRLTENF